MFIREDLYAQTGVVFNIQRFSLHDGPGIRTLVFLKGCALRCKWCSNPEAQSGEIHTAMLDGKQTQIGNTMSVRDVMQIVPKDEIYYRRSGGGLTLSGGEPLLQSRFAAALLHACKLRGYHTAIETAGFVKYKAFERVLPYLDLIMMDIKHMDAAKHAAFTGQTNDTILENIQQLAKQNVRLIVRVPVIPTFNDTPEEIRAIAEHARSLNTVRELHLLAYHRLGAGKYKMLGRDYEMSGVAPLPNEKMQQLLQVAKSTGLQCQIGG